MYTKRTQICVLAALALVGAMPSPAPAGELWLVSTRHLGCECSPGEPQVWRYGPDGCWVSSRSDEFLQTADPAVPITIMLHGNRNEVARSIKIGWDVYGRLNCDAGDRPFRQVIWSWPSDRIKGLRRDAEAKICRSDCEAHHLAALLNRLRPDARVNLFGFSLGSRIATGALQLLAGGQVAGRALADRNPASRVPMRAMLVAAAEDAGSLVPGGYHGLATGLLEQIFATRNTCDRALRLYPRVDRCASQALGFSGPYCSTESGVCAKFDVVDASCAVGRDHSWETYWNVADVQSRLAWYAFLADSTPGPTPAE